MADKQTDILIIGGGLTGATLLQALQCSGHRCLLLEAQTLEQQLQIDLNSRSLALSPASVNILQQLGIWPALKANATPIEKIHVSQKGRFGRATLCRDIPLGHLIEMPHLLAQLQAWLPAEQTLTQTTFQSFGDDCHSVHCVKAGTPLTIKAKLVIAADGMNSAVRQTAGFEQTTHDYQQSAILTNIKLKRPHQNQAFERFTQEGPLAMLPLSGNRCALVWAMSPQKAKAIAQLEERAFLKTLQSAFGYYLGRFEQAGKRIVAPLSQSQVPNPAKWPVVLVGNAAQTLHPVAGQGFNLALRDVATLGQLISQQGLSDAMLAQYQQKRQPDRQAITQFTDGLLRLFGQSLPGMGIIRGLGLLAFDNNPAFKAQLSRYAQGFGGKTPDLACGIPLTNGAHHD